MKAGALMAIARVISTLKKSDFNRVAANTGLTSPSEQKATLEASTFKQVVMPPPPSNQTPDFLLDNIVDKGLTRRLIRMLTLGEFNWPSSQKVEFSSRQFIGPDLNCA
jgi:hypothetical protein